MFLNPSWWPRSRQTSCLLNLPWSTAASLTFPVLDHLTSWGVPIRYFVKCPWVWIFQMFFSWSDGNDGFGGRLSLRGSILITSSPGSHHIWKLKKKKSIRRHTLKIPKSSQVKVLLLLFVCYCCCCCCFLNKKRPNLGAWDSCWITLNCACGCMSRTRTNEPSSVSSACLRKCPLFCWQVFGKMNDFPGRDKILLKP